MKILNRRYTKTEACGILSIIFGLGLLYDFHRRGFDPLGLLMPVVLMIFGQVLRKWHKFIFGNILFVLGALGLSFTLFSMIAIQWVFVAVIIYMGYQLFAGRPEDLDLKATILEHEYEQSEPMFKNFLIGHLRSPDMIYDLSDINFQFGLGDVALDFSNTIIPEGETIIMIRGIVGKIQLAIPYDIELSIQTSTFMGHLHILDKSDRFFNTTQKYRTKDYEAGNRKIRIIATTFIGDIEVSNL